MADITFINDSKNSIARIFDINAVPFVLFSYNCKFIGKCAKVTANNIKETVMMVFNNLCNSLNNQNHPSQTNNQNKYNQDDNQQI